MNEVIIAIVMGAVFVFPLLGVLGLMGWENYLEHKREMYDLIANQAKVTETENGEKKE